jgi:hypothetical protein
VQPQKSAAERKDAWIVVKVQKDSRFSFPLHKLHSCQFPISKNRISKMREGQDVFFLLDMGGQAHTKISPMEHDGFPAPPEARVPVVSLMRAATLTLFTP